MRSYEKTQIFLIWLSPILIYILLRFAMPFINSIKNRCLFYDAFNLFCPGCGGTRAVAMLVKGNIFTSLAYNFIPFILLAGYFAFAVLFSVDKIFNLSMCKKIFGPHIIWLVLLLVLVNFVVHNLWPMALLQSR
jgi:hypothetical protein